MSQQTLPTQAQLDGALTPFGRDLGSGVAFPASGPSSSALRRGDAYFHSTYGALFLWNGTAWRARGPGELTAAQRGALATGPYAGFEVFETDTKLSWRWDGAAWVALSLVSGKMWRTGGSSAAMTSATEYVVNMGAARVTGGFTYDQTAQSGQGALVLPLDGYYSFVVYTYVTNGASGLVGNWLTRIRTAVANSNFVTGPIGNKASTAIDGLFSWATMNYPLKAGDKISLSIYPYVGGLSYYGAGEAQGCVVEATYRGPLSGATPV